MMKVHKVRSHVVLMPFVRRDVASEERIASIIRVTRTGEIKTMLASQRVSFASYC
jgi:hypothetical protein